MKKAKIVGWDLEATSLTANWGTILCGGVKDFLTKKPVEMFSIDDYKDFKKDSTNDRKLVVDIRDRLAEADIWVTWYGAGYDVPMLNTRLLFHGEKPLPQIPHIDLWKTSRHQLKLTSNRLAAVQGFFGFKEEKSPVEGTTWVRAISGNQEALKYIKEHCKKDVLVLEEGYVRLRPLIKAHPNLNIIQGTTNRCPTCGEDSVRHDGIAISGVSTIARYRCDSCGATPKSGPRRVKGVEPR